MEIAILLSSVLILVLLVVLLLRKNNAGQETEQLEKYIREEFSLNRKENTEGMMRLREDLQKSFRELVEENRNLLDKLNKEINDRLEKLTESNGLKLQALGEKQAEEARKNREEQTRGLKEFADDFTQKTKALNDLLRTQFTEQRKQQAEHTERVDKQADRLRLEVKEKLAALQEDNSKKLEEMRATVDEKLQKTLSERLGQSFETVGKQLKQVQEGLGEMKNLAQDVGGLKKVLSNVKNRGGLGEIQLEMLLEQILAPDQYEANVRTKSGSMDAVEFAVKLPGRDDIDKKVLLPIDAKFPKDAYDKLQEAYEAGDKDLIERENKAIENVIKKMAKDIRDKYLDPPNTTDFAIMFLPFESIYAEVIRRSHLLEQLQREFKVIVTGPTTLAAILNSLQMGFRTLAIQKRSSEVWEVLGAVKTEFNKFGDLLGKAQKNLQTANNQLDEVLGRRTRAINRKLQRVQELPAAESAKILTDLTGSVEDDLED